MLYGKVNPGGKLPVTFPRKVGTVPLYYNHEPTGRPCSPTFKWNSRYRDLATCKPLYEFGYGLSYTTFDVSTPRLSKTTVSRRTAASPCRSTSRTPAASRVTRSSRCTSTTRWRASPSR